MTKIEYIILPSFGTIEEGVNYLDVNVFDFYFSVEGLAYTELGESTDLPENYEIVPIEGVHIELYENPEPGQLYIENNLLKYYKEDRSASEEDL